MGSQPDEFLEDRTAFRLTETDDTLTPSDLRKLPESTRRLITKKATARIRRSLRTMHIVLGSLALVFSIVLWAVIFVIPIPADKYDACFYMILGAPGDVVPALLSLGCVSVFLVTTIALALYGLIYHLLVTGTIGFRAYYDGLKEGKYNNRSRWIFRAATVPIFYLIALQVSGARDFLTMAILLLFCAFVDILRWIAERKTLYSFSVSRNMEVLTNKGRLTLLASGFMAAIVAISQLVFLIIFVVQDIDNVPLITWIYGISFFLYYTVGAFWFHISMAQSVVPYQSRLSLETTWDIYDTVGFMLLTGAATLGVTL